IETGYLIGNLVTTPVPAPISVSIAPTSASLSVAGTTQFTPTISNSTQGVAWTVSPNSLGSISASGLFTATGAGQGTVTASSIQDHTKSASATVTVSTTPVPPPTGGITVTVTPSALSLSVGATHQFAASVTQSTEGVTWSVHGAIGSIDKNGLFKALSVGTGSVKATSVQDPTKSHSVQVTVTAQQCQPASGGGGGEGDDGGGRPTRHDN
ncbi:MAG: Ig-like domain-containing protein, partial [Candidatus Dormibacteraeota bacterium]|nr:Ig-like domain-containing protein [Candidatus Dormibacteraeota bacterium]